MRQHEKLTGRYMGPHIHVALENVRSAHNVGAILRTMDAAGAGELYLIGTTPTPIDRFGRVQPDIAKTALGAEKTIPWRYFETTSAFLTAIKADSVHVVAIEQDAFAVDYKILATTDPLVLVFGNEVTGISQEILDSAEHIAEIPMHGQKESLNVSVAVGVVLYRLLDT